MQRTVVVGMIRGENNAPITINISMGGAMGIKANSIWGAVLGNDPGQAV
ncbi:MAG: hypothetical protein ACLTEF_02575 [[Clostridium] leptum]